MTWFFNSGRATRILPTTPVWSWTVTWSPTVPRPTLTRPHPATGPPSPRPHPPRSRANPRTPRPPTTRPCSRPCATHRYDVCSHGVAVDLNAYLHGAKLSGSWSRSIVIWIGNEPQSDVREWYRARKSRTTLQNKVRLKVLPEQFTLYVN